jgi:hypothetical protein
LCHFAETPICFADLSPLRPVVPPVAPHPALFLSSGWNIGYWPFRVDYSHAGLVAKRIGRRSPRLICGKRVPFALLTRADQGGTHPGLAGECQRHRRQKIATTEGWIRRDLASCFLASLGFPFALRGYAYANERIAHEAPRLHSRKLRWHKTSICKLRIDFQKVRYVF